MLTQYMIIQYMIAYPKLSLNNSMNMFCFSASKLWGRMQDFKLLHFLKLYIPS